MIAKGLVLLVALVAIAANGKLVYQQITSTKHQTRQTADHHQHSDLDILFAQCNHNRRQTDHRRHQHKGNTCGKHCRNNHTNDVSARCLYGVYLSARYTPCTIANANISSMAVTAEWNPPCCGGTYSSCTRLAVVYVLYFWADRQSTAL